ncbi:hypothetical protein BJ684DRAFT_22488 [Piptocephalis cylindrospora]|uniref:MI domain-containing protein n=1 Tax=Piptocephalis cylindrospora TaxID=1907219 RepID=A0A4V1IYI1_9FUNG|nr:hypothetical protein BJ684DRAFT_22488 [Piptocephalis cylindrospora]|eukprot:RKP14639.1 hypothetical protein BJ684DRAFT_22488 [Piptocephalis cylindrospora]
MEDPDLDIVDSLPEGKTFGTVQAVELPDPFLSPPGLDQDPVFDYNTDRKRERERQMRERVPHPDDMEKVPVPLDEQIRSMASTTRTGGVYIPRFRLRQMQAQITDKSSTEYQRIHWDNLKKQINGLVNKVNTDNIKEIIPELFSANLVRGQALFARSIMKAQSVALPFTPVYAALVAVVNSKFPAIGGLILSRLVIQFRRALRRNDKALCLSSTRFIAHLCNQLVAHEILALQILAILLKNHTDDSVEIAVGFTREVGAHLHDVVPKPFNVTFEWFRTLLHEATLEKRVQYMIEVLFQVRKEKFSKNPPIPEELDLVEEEDQETHTITLDDEDLEVKEGLGVFKYDPDFVKNEDQYNAIKRELLGEESDEEDASGGSEADSESSDGEGSSDEEGEEGGRAGVSTTGAIQDATGTDLVSLRRVIYLTIMSSANFEECTHKLLNLRLADADRPELCNMIIECCAQERTYTRFYGLIGERVCKVHRTWSDMFVDAFRRTYDTIHRYETNRLRNVAKFFSNLLAGDAIPWAKALSCIRLTEEDTTSASRIFIKILMQELGESMGLAKLNQKLKDPYEHVAYAGLFPTDDPRHTRFAINFFTSIGLGALTEELREHLKNLPKDSSSDASSILSSSTLDEEGERGRSRQRGRGRSARRRSQSCSSSGRSRSYSRSSRSASWSSRGSRSVGARSNNASLSPRRGKGAGRTRSISRSPPSSFLPPRRPSSPRGHSELRRYGRDRNPSLPPGGPREGRRMQEQVPYRSRYRSPPRRDGRSPRRSPIGNPRRRRFRSPRQSRGSRSPPPRALKEKELLRNGDYHGHHPSRPEHPIGQGRNDSPQG